MLPNQTGYGNIAIALNFLVTEMNLNGTGFTLQTYLRAAPSKGDGTVSVCRGLIIYIGTKAKWRHLQKDM